MSAALQQKPDVKIKMTVVAGPHVGQVFQLNKSGFTIGRGPENDLVLMNDPMVSRMHVRIEIVDRDLEINNLSQKNAVLVDGQTVQKWKIVNNSNFIIGDTEFKVEYDLGQAVASIPTQKPAPVLPLKPKAPPAQSKLDKLKPKMKGAASAKKAPRPAQPMALQNGAIQNGVPRNGVPANRGVSTGGPSVPAQMRTPLTAAPMGMAVGTPRPQVFQQQPTAGFGARPVSEAAQDSLISNPRFKFYMAALIIFVGAYFYLFSGDDKKKAVQKQIDSTLNYTDAVQMKLNSQTEKDRVATLDGKRRDRNSIQSQRIEENLMKGMRDFNMGNYARAQEFFQLVLNLDPDHQLAKRHIYLSRVRFDEIVQEKLMLGESYFKKHNFKMCESMYRQVVVMLQGKNNDQKLLLAEKKAKECQLADEGIR